MALKQKWLVEARLELEATLEYVQREFGQRIVDMVYSDVVTRICLLQEYPDLGQRYKDLVYRGHEVRILHMKKSSIIYCHDEEILYILTFWNNSRDDSLLGDIIAVR